MPRINVEDSLFADVRFMKLAMKLGGLEFALGSLVLVWMTAQKWYLTPEKMIPFKEWKKQGLQDAILEVGFAEKIGEKIRVCGSDDQFKWLEQRIMAGRKGGLSSGKQRKNTTEEAIKRNGARALLNRAVKEGKITKPQFCEDCGLGDGVIEGHHSDYSKPYEVNWLCKPCHTETHRNIRNHSHISEAEVKQTKPKATLRSPSLPLSPSLFPSQTLDQEKTKNRSARGEALPAETKNVDIPFFIGTYVKAYQTRYGPKARPELTGKVQGEIKRLLKDTPIERACEMIQAYVQMNDAWFLNKGHDFGSFMANLTKVSLALDTGRQMLGSRAREIERMQHNSDSWDQAVDFLQRRDQQNEATK